MSSLTGYPRALIRFKNPGRSGCNSGSPPVIHTPSSSLLLLLKKAKNSSFGIVSDVGPVIKPLLWQNGQRKSQPPKKTVHATFPGQSKSVIFCRPCISIALPLFLYYASLIVINWKLCTPNIVSTKFQSEYARCCISGIFMMWLYRLDSILRVNIHWLSRWLYRSG